MSDMEQTGIPRQKCYITIQKLERKHLARVLPGKPIRCQAIAPENSFGDLIKTAELRLDTMKNSIKELNRMIKIRSEGITKEIRSTVVPAKLLEPTITELLSVSKKGVYCVLGGWAAGNVSKIVNAAEELILEGKIKVIFDYSSIDEISNGASLLDYSRVCDTGLEHTVLVVDKQSTLIIENTEGTGLLIESVGLSSLMVTQLLDRLWINSIPYRTVLNSGSETDPTMMKKLNSKEVTSFFIRAVSDSTRDPQQIARIGKRFLELIHENLGVNLFDYPIEKGVEIMTSLLLDEFQGGSSPDSEMSLASSGKADESPWSFGIAGILQRSRPQIRG
jgi:sugar-specific transcriptional regulator TrmB